LHFGARAKIIRRKFSQEKSKVPYVGRKKSVFNAA